MSVYTAGPRGQCWYGEAIGILILNACYPCVPGNVGNATTFSYPVRYKVVSEASIDGLLRHPDAELLKAFVRAAQQLEQEGVRGITGACGFMAIFQRQVAEAVRIPVFLSSLLQVPLIRQMLAPDKKIGVITAESRCLRPEHLRAVGIVEDESLVIRGMEGSQEFSEAVLQEKGTLDSTLIERDLVMVAREMVSETPELGAIVLECSDLPPYAHAVQRAVNLPVFDFTTLIDFMHSALVRMPFTGHM